MTVKKFSKEWDKDTWDEFVSIGKNKSFLFYRDFMDYHSDRFVDTSYMIFDEKSTLIALIPANISNLKPGTIISHEGLTYGGIIVKKDVKLKTVIGIFYHFLKYLNQDSVESFQLKQIPAFYNATITDEIEYVMFLLEASLFRRDVALVIDQSNKINCSGNIRRESEKAKKAGTVIKEEQDMTAFWENILVPNLAERFGVKPVHSLSEIHLLKTKFPGNIRQFNTFLRGQIVAGVTLFIEGSVVHSQYISSNDEGRRTGALNYLFRYLIDEVFVDYKYFDFGIVNEENGKKINEGMLFWKESFGGRSMRHDFYSIPTNSFVKLENYLV
jgi:GNAT acetyltransferase-like protein